MDKKTVFVKTEKGESETQGRSDALFGDVKRILQLVDDESTVGEISKRAPPSLRESLLEMLQTLEDGSYIRNMRAPVNVASKVELKMSAPTLKMATPGFKMATPKAAQPVPPPRPIPPPVVVSPLPRATFSDAAGAVPSMQMPDMSMPVMPSAAVAEVKNTEPVKTDENGDLDFSFITSAPSPRADQVEPDNKLQIEAWAKAEAKTTADAIDKARAEAVSKANEEAAEKAVKAKAYEDAKVKAQVEATAKEAKVKAAKAKADEDTKLKAQNEAAAAAKAAKVKADEDAKVKAQSEAAVKAAKAKAYEDAKVKAQIEVAARAQVEAEARVKKEAEIVKKNAELEALKVRAELEATKARIEAEVRTRLEAEAKAKKEAEERVRQEANALRLKAEKEAERLRQELEAAKLKAEMEIRIRLEAEAKAKAEQEARLRREAEAERMILEKKRAELEIARIKVEAEIKMREEAEIRVRAAMDASAKAEALARQAEENKLKQHSLNAAEGNASLQDEHAAGEKLKQSFVESFGQRNKNVGSATGSFKLENFSLLDTGRIPILTEQVTMPTPLPGAGSKVKAAIEAKANKEAVAEKLRQAQHASAQLAGEQEEAARVQAQQAKAAALAQAEQDRIRLKAAHESYRLKVQQEEEEQARAAAEAEKLSIQQARQWDEAQQRAAALAQVEKDRLTKQHSEAEIKSSLKRNRGPRKSLPIGKFFGGLLVLVVLAVFGLPYVWAPDGYIPVLEAEMSAQIKQPIHIQKTGFSLLPWPKLDLIGVTVGNAEEIKIGNIEVIFDFSALFAPTKSISDLKFSNVTLAGFALEKTLGWLQTAGGLENYPVTRMEFKGVHINAEEMKLPLLSGVAKFDPQGKFTHANLSSDDAKLVLEMSLLQGNLRVEVNVHESPLPIFPTLKFNDLSVNVSVANGQIILSDFFAHIHGGTLTGKGHLDWNNGWKLQGLVNARNLDLNKMFPDFVLSGEMLGEVKVVMASTLLSQLAKDASIEGSFEAKNGVIAKIDVENIARFGARPGVAGHTNFKELSGTIKSNNEGLRISVSKLASASANTSGLIDVDENQKLSGKLNVDIRGVVNASIPLQLSGSAKDPILKSNNP